MDWLTFGFWRRFITSSFGRSDGLWK